MVSKRKRKGGSKGLLPKASLQKLSNKRLNKLAKQGKLKKCRESKQLRKLINERVNPDQQAHLLGEVPQNDEPEDIPLQEADYDYYTRPDRDFSFLSQVDSRDEDGRSKRKRPCQDKVEDIESKYEKQQKRLPEQQVEMKVLLPIKTPEKGIIQRIMQVPMDNGDEQVSREKDTEADVQPEETENKIQLPAISMAQLLAQRNTKLQKKREQIAILSNAIMDQPQQHFRHLKELRNMLTESDPDLCVSVSKLVTVSLSEVFKDIIPDYRIRVVTDKEKTQMAKKETKELRQFEESLISNYRAYLEFLENTAKGKPPKVKGKHQKNGSVPSKVPQEAFKNMREVCVRCLCELLAVHPHFNFRTNIIAVICPFMTHRNSQLSNLVCNCVKRIFKEDKSGDVTLEITRLIGRLIKSRNFDVPAKILDTFLALKIKEIDRQGDKLESKSTRKENYRKLSRRDRKRHKQMGSLEKELQDAAAEDNKQRKLRLHTEIINMIFLTYFRILKQARHSLLLSTVLEGLARFAHLINIDFFNDLFAVLNELVDSKELTYRESLHCVQTAFTILSGQGSSLNIDPLQFYTHLYRTLFQLHAGHSSEDVLIALQCLDIMISKRRKQVSHQRTVAFIKRMCTLALQMAAHGALGFLSATRTFLHAYPRSDILFDVESQGSGIFLPELEEPEHCNASNTALYELHLLRHHYHPAVRKYSDHVLLGAPSQGHGALPADVARKTTCELYDEFDPSDMTFQPAIEPKLKSTKVRLLKSLKPFNQELDKKITDVLALPDNAVSQSNFTNFKVHTNFVTSVKTPLSKVCPSNA